MQNILVTGSNGILGRQVVKGLVEASYNVLGISVENEPVYKHEKYSYKQMDIIRCIDVEALFEENSISHIVHLAAIAHTYKGMDDSWSQYYRINTLCSKTVFNCARSHSIPVFFASTVDVYGVTKGEVDENIDPNPIGSYARSKMMAEKALAEICDGSTYQIVRFAPIYTEENRKDIEKRYFIKYPNICYLIGDGREYEFLAVEKAVKYIIDWVGDPNTGERIKNLCDAERQNTRDLIIAEREKGNAKLVIRIPNWIANLVFACVKKCFAQRPSFIFLISKIFKPIRLKSN